MIKPEVTCKPQVLSHVQFEHIMKRFPGFELSYETVSHKKVSPSYNSCFAIPQGKKCYAWFTFLGDQDVCFVFDLNRDKKIVKAYQYTVEVKHPLALGTLLYGTFVEENENKPFFIIEDILHCKGIPMKNCNSYQRLEFIKDALVLLPREFTDKNTLLFSLPVFWEVKETEDFELSCVIPQPIADNIGYVAHHLQYRSLFEIAPYINVQFTRPKLATAQIVRKSAINDIHISDIDCDFSKPQYNEPTIFQVRADLQFDVYHLYAYNPKTQSVVYYGLACVPNYKTSVIMNTLFRKIRENKNLDYIEESDDEEDFQNNAEDKYVDLGKRVNMTCMFHRKFKKWVPIAVTDKRAKLVMVDRLSRDNRSTNSRTTNSRTTNYNNNTYNNNRKPFHHNNRPMNFHRQHDRKIYA